MNTFGQMVLGTILLAFMGWYILYQVKPQLICKKHPNVEMQKSHIYCWPGVDVAKETWLDGYFTINGKKHIPDSRFLEK